MFHFSLSLQQQQQQQQNQQTHQHNQQIQQQPTLQPIQQPQQTNHNINSINIFKEPQTPNPFLSSQSQREPGKLGVVYLHGQPIVSLTIESKERLCLAQISNTLLKVFSYNEIHNR